MGLEVRQRARNGQHLIDAGNRERGRMRRRAVSTSATAKRPAGSIL